MKFIEGVFYHKTKSSAPGDVHQFGTHARVADAVAKMKQHNQRWANDKEWGKDFTITQLFVYLGGKLIPIPLH